MRENRQTELEVLTVVSTADRRGPPLHMDAGAAATTTSSGDLKRALARLALEHMVVVDDAGMLTGLHRLRSEAASKAVHRIPPPTPSATHRALVNHVGVHELPVLVAGANAEVPALRDGLAEALSDRASG